MFHYRKTHKHYRSFPRPAVCSFCDDDIAARAVRQTEHALVIPNRVSYDVWEMRDVVDHLMIVPRLHVENLAALSDAAKLDVMQLIGEYEQKGYNIYARATTSTVRSVPHQHTHLIKTGHKHARATLTVAKPYMLVKI